MRGEAVDRDPADRRADEESSERRERSRDREASRAGQGESDGRRWRTRRRPACLSSPLLVHPPIMPERFAAQQHAGVLHARASEAALNTLALLVVGTLDVLVGLGIVLAGIGHVLGRLHARHHRPRSSVHATARPDGAASRLTSSPATSRAFANTVRATGTARGSIASRLHRPG